MYVYNNKKYPKETVDMMYRIYCIHDCNSCKEKGKRNIHHICNNIKKE